MSRKTDFTLVEIMIVVAIIGLLAAIAIPSFVRARTTSQTKACVNNLRQIDGGKDQWAIENNKVDSDTVTMANVLTYLKKSPSCPASGSYSVSSVSADPECSLGGNHTI